MIGRVPDFENAVLEFVKVRGDIGFNEVVCGACAKFE